MDKASSSVEFAIDAPVAGSYTLKISYGNGTSGESTQSVLVNGSPVATAVYAPTGGWLGIEDPRKVHRTTEVVIQLATGYNRVALQKANGFAEIDYVQLLVDN